MNRWHRVALRGMRREEGESSTLYVAVIFYGLSRIMLERESALPTVQDVSEIPDAPAKDITYPGREFHTSRLLKLT